MKLNKKTNKKNKTNKKPTSLHGYSLNVVTKAFLSVNKRQLKKKGMSST